MTLPVSIRVNVRVPFPTQVNGSAFITVAKANGVWTIAPNYTVLAEFPTMTGTQEIVAYDPASGSFGILNPFTIAGAGAYRIVTVSPTITVGATDQKILTNLVTPATITVNLPLSNSMSGPITVKDYAGNAATYNITFVPQTGETIDGFSASDAVANGVALIDTNYGAKTLYPLLSGGWFWIP